MALIKPGPLIADIRGSIGGTTFARNRGGLYVRNRTTPLNPQSAAQVSARARMGGLANDWTTVITQLQRDAWDAWAGQVPVPNAFGEDRFLSGINAYVAANSLLLQAGEARIDDAPEVFARGPTVQGIYTLTAATNGIALTSVAPFVAPAEGVNALIFASPPQNVGITFYKGPFRFVGNVALTPAGAELPAALGASPFPFVVGQAVFMRLRIVTPDARVGGSTVGRFLGV